MDCTVTAAISSTKTINALSTPANRKITNLTTLNPICSQNKPKSSDFYASNNFLNPSKSRNPYFRNKSSKLSVVHCSRKPNTDRENATDENLSSLQPSSNSRIQEQTTAASPTTNQGISLNPSFSRGLVFDLGLKKDSSWDSAEIGSPVVKRFLGDEEERWYMWYRGRRSNGNDSIGLALSNNGIHWERGEGAVKSSSDVGMVMNCSDDWWAFDTRGIRPSEVVIMSSTKVRVNNSLYWLYYTGFNDEKIESLEFKLKKALPGLAMSQDGRHWARIEGEHHSGALFDVGSKGEWDSLFISSPQVVYHGAGDMRMYYHSFDAEKGHFAVGIARSRDGMKWVKLGKILGGDGNGMFDEVGVMNANVVKNRKDGKYLMAYEGVGADGRRSIGLAISSDGLKEWRRFQNGPVLEQSEEDGWDCEGVGSPCLVQMDGNADEWRLYYRGIGKGGKTGIGLAVCQGTEFASFQRWTGFHL
ncbi:hypothetical protein ACH5RR_030503 [Cinchona calisaya]|uniref:Arabinanase/levansucrase/invertase n=1 Tax=Cinchona calisaya TaxID=153742 RepID=A0ABD2YY09_9GENT